MSDRSKSRRSVSAPTANHPADRRLRRAAAAGRPAMSAELLEGRTLFAAFVVNSFADLADPDPAVTTLREAFDAADLNAQADTISFDPAVFGVPRTITLTASQLNGDVDTAKTTIVGPGAKLLTINAGGSHRALALYGGTSVELSGVTITGGSADRGGALRNYGSTLAVTDAVITGNSATGGGGGGVYNQAGGNTTLTRTTISGNTASGDGGGGVGNRSGAVALVNATVSGNSSFVGGGVYTDTFGSTPAARTTLTNSTVTGNTATFQGGGVYADDEVLTLNNTIVSGNAAGIEPDVYADDGTAGSNNLIGGAALLGPLQDNGGPTPTHALLAGSPAINAGGNAAAAGLTTDQRGPGFARVADGTVDIGAFEVQDATPVTVTINQAATQADPTINSPVLFTVVFSEPVTDFDDASDVVLSGTAGATTATITPVAGGTTYTVAVSGMTSGGTVVATVAANAAVDALGNPNYGPSTSTDNSVTYVVPVPSLVVTTAADEDNGNSDPSFGTGTSLREAIAYAKLKPGDDTITFAPAVTTIVLGGTQLTIDDAAAKTTIQGPGVTVDGDDASRVFNIAAGADVVLAGLTITGGADGGFGGGVLTAGSVTLRDAVVRGNAANTGGGLASLGGTVRIERTTFADNTASAGGAAALYSSDSVVRDSTFSGNRSDGNNGSALLNYAEQADSAVVVVNSTFSGNDGSAGSVGAALLNDTAGSIGAFTASMTLINSTVAGNRTATTTAAGVFSRQAGSGTAVLRVQNSIVAGNRRGPAGSDVADDVFANGTYTAAGSVIGVQGVTGVVVPDGTNGNVTGVLDPLLAPLANNGGPTETRLPLPTSPAVNRGTDALAVDEDGNPLATDQRGAGFPRKVGFAVDAGAVEAPLPTFNINPQVEVVEGNSGTTPITFTVTRTNGVGPAAVDFTTVDGTAGVSGDYNHAAASVFFPDGVTSKTVTVFARGDTAIEPDQDFFVVLSNPTNGTVGAGIGRAVILNDDTATPQLSVGDAAVTEGNGGTKTLKFTVTLNRPTDHLVTFKYKTTNGTATSGGDFTAVTGTGKLVPRQLSTTVSVTVKGDATFEPDEVFFLDLSAPNDATIADGRGVGTIVNDDAKPRITINNAADVVEGNSGTRTMTFTVKLSNPSAGSVTVKYATADGTATVAKNDYKAKTGTLTFAAGETSKTVTVTIVGDTRKGTAYETVFVNLSSPVGASILDGQGVGRIVNDD